MSANNLPEPSDMEVKDHLVFPMNVYEYVTTSSGLKSSDKKSMLFTAWIFISALLLWLLVNLTRSVTNHYWVLSIVILAAIEFLVGGVILSYVFDIEPLGHEMSRDDQSFAQYFGAVKPIKANPKAGLPYDLYEFKDGSVAIYIQLEMGYNTTQLSQAGCELIAEYANILNKAKLPYRTYVSVEDFKNSSAAKNLMNSVKNVKDPQLFQQYRNIVQNLIDIATTQSNVPVTTYVVYAKNRIQREDLVPTVRRLINLAQDGQTCYRSVTVKTCEEIVNFYRDYTKLKIIDMGLVRAQAVDVKSPSSRLPILKIYGDKAVYSTSDFNKLQEVMLKEHGLPEIKK